jgi:hypothetical protein
MAKHAISVAFPFKSAVAEAADGDVLAIRKVLVVCTLILPNSSPKTREATWAILVLTPCPISTAPVLIPTEPSPYTWTNALAWFMGVLVKEIPKHMGINEMPFL